MSDPRDSSSPFGVMDFLPWDSEQYGFHYTQEEVEKSAQMMKAAGVGFVRFGMFWSDVENKSGEFNFDKYDFIVDTLRKYGLKINAILAYNTTHAGQAWNDAPDARTYSRYAQKTVEHFRDRIRHWEVWHEPDNPAFWRPQDRMQSYVNLLKQVYPLLKAIDPTCVVHLGGMSHSLPMSLKQIYSAGSKPFFDVINIHPFANPLTDGAVDAIRHMHELILQVLTEYDDADKPIWFTEIGCPGMQNPNDTKEWWLGANTTETDQANWVQTIYGEFLKWKNVEKIFWCFFRDTDRHFQCGSDYDGLVRHDFTLKPAFSAYQRVSKEWSS